MSRQPSATDFTVSVEGIGAFTFAKRTMRDELRIAAEFSRVCEGVEEPNEFLRTVGSWISTLRVLTVSAPAGWDLDEMDPLDEDTYANLFKVHFALREKEGSFRRKGKTGQGAGPEVGEESAVLVSPQVQPAADGSPVSGRDAGGN